VSVYGVMDEFVGRTETTDSKGVKSTVNGVMNGGLTTPFVGIRGAEDLGGGLAAVFALESFIRPSFGAIGRNDADPFWGRLSVVGLDSPYGKVTLGRHVTPYSLATTLNTSFVGTTTISPIFTNVYNLNVLGGTRLDNSVQYSSPVVGGFRGEVLYSFGAQNSSISTDPKAGRAFEAVGTYRTGPLRLTTGYHSINQNKNKDGHDQSAYMVAAVYDFGFVKVDGQYHRTRENFALSTNNSKHNTYELGASVPVGAGLIMASYAHTKADDLLPSTPNARSTWAVAYDYFVSKRTDLYVGYYRDKLENPQTLSTIFAAGIRHRF
jgi:predicted porin